MSEFHYQFDGEGNVTNGYEPAPGETKVIPPIHFGQEWQTYQNDVFNLGDELSYTYQNEWHAVYTVYLGELVQSGVFDWKRPELDWSSAAIDAAQYERVCAYFLDRFKWREISMLPILKWFDYLKRKLVYELMPKYKPLYERVSDGINPLQDGNEYYKNRTINSSYPETLLSENADFITDGRDEEYQRIKESNVYDTLEGFQSRYKGVDELMLDELEDMFISLYTTNVNGL